MRDSKALGVELKQLRAAQQLTQAQLAQKAGVARSSVIDLEQGKPTIELRTLLSVASALRSDVTLSPNLRPSEALTRVRAQILEAASALDITDVRVFGSSARGDDAPDSDIDLLVHSPDDMHPGDLELFREKVQQLTGFGVDLLTDGLRGAKYDLIREAAVPL